MSATDLAHAVDRTDDEPVDAGADDAADGPVGGLQGADVEASGSSGTATGASEPDKDVLFDILRNQRRRRTLDFLRENPTTTLSDLAEHVAALENDKPIRELTSSERKRVYVGLYQCHLPKMADAGLIDYDRSRGTIRLREAASPCFVYLDIEPNRRPDGAESLGGRVYRRLTTLSAHLRR